MLSWGIPHDPFSIFPEKETCGSFLSVSPMFSQPISCLGHQLAGD